MQVTLRNEHFPCGHLGSFAWELVKRDTGFYWSRKLVKGQLLHPHDVDPSRADARSGGRTSATGGTRCFPAGEPHPCLHVSQETGVLVASASFVSLNV